MQLTNEMKVALKSFLFEALKTPNSKVIAIIQKILSQKETHSAEITIAVEALKTIQKNIKAEKEESEDLINSLLANCAQRGIGYNDNEKKLAYELCKAASEKQYPLAQYVMARCLRFKNGCVQSVTESVKYYIAAAKKNIVCAQTELALIFEKSNLKEVPKDPVKAEKLRKIAVQQTQLMESTINKIPGGKLQAELFSAIQAWSLQKIKAILKTAPELLDVEYVFEDGSSHTPLFYSIKIGFATQSRWVDKVPFEQRKEIFLFFFEQKSRLHFPKQGTIIHEILNSELQNEKLNILKTIFESKRRAEILSILKDKNYNLTQRKETLLHRVCEMRDHAGCGLNMDTVCLSIMKYLFEQGLGSEIDSQNHLEETCLHLTVNKNYFETTRFLLEQKAKTELINYWGQTPLETTYLDSSFEPHMQSSNERSERAYFSIRELLREFGAKEIDIPALNFPGLPKFLMDELTQEYRLKNTQIEKLSELEQKELAADSAVVEKLMQQRQILEFTCKTEVEIKTIKDKHPNAFYFIQPPRKGYRESDYKVLVYYDLTEAEKKTIANLQSRTRAIIHKNRLGFELLHRAMGSLDGYLKQFPNITQKFLGKNIEFIDLTQATDYRFFVHTIKTNPDQLRELIAGEPRFFDFVPFMSVCLLDKGTRGFAGTHQRNKLFPTYLVLDVPVDAIHYLGATDIGSPYNCDSKTKTQYLNSTEITRITMDWRQAHYQLRGLAKPSNSCLPDSPYVVRKSLESDPKFKEPGYKYKGSLPLYTAEGLLRDSNCDPQHDMSYNECIIKGNALLPRKKITAKLLLVEKSLLEKFNKDIAEYETPDDYDKQRAESLELFAQLPKLTNGRIKLALIDTDMFAFRRKHSLLKQLETLEFEKPVLIKQWTVLARKLERFKMNGQVVPKNIAEEARALKERIDNLPKLQQELVGLAQNPPLLTASRRPDLNFPNVKNVGSGGSAAAPSNYSKSMDMRDFKSKK